MFCMCFIFLSYHLVLCFIIYCTCLIQHLMLQYSINHWLIDWLIDWLLDWLIDCLIDWLIEQCTSVANSVALARSLHMCGIKFIRSYFLFGQIRTKQICLPAWLGNDHLCTNRSETAPQRRVLKLYHHLSASHSHPSTLVLGSFKSL